MRLFNLARWIRDRHSTSHLRVPPRGPIACLAPLYVLLLGGGCTPNFPDPTMPANCYISGRQDLYVVFADETLSKAALREARTWVVGKFSWPPRIDLTEYDGYPDPPPDLHGIGLDCDAIYTNNPLSIEHCGVVSDSVLRRYARIYRGLPENIINTHTFQSTPYLVLFVDFPVHTATGTYLMGRTLWSNVVASGYSYVFDSELERFVAGSTGIPGYHQAQRENYKKNVLRWNVAHELGHLTVFLSEASTAGKHRAGVLCIMQPPSQEDIVMAREPIFCSDGDSDTLNTCADNLASYFHLWTCANP